MYSWYMPYIFNVVYLLLGFVRFVIFFVLFQVQVILSNSDFMSVAGYVAQAQTTSSWITPRVPLAVGKPVPLRFLLVNVIIVQNDNFCIIQTSQKIVPYLHSIVTHYAILNLCAANVNKPFLILSLAIEHLAWS